MVIPDYFMSSLSPWDTWISITTSSRDTEFLCESDGLSINRPQYNVEDKHPGFIAVYKTLTALGCDKYFVTSVLKYCIIQADGNLYDFLTASEVQKSIPTALSIGMTGVEFVGSLSISTIECTDSLLPNDMSLLKS